MTFARVTVAVAGILAALLGLTVLYGWYTHNLELIHVQPNWVGMAYNTSLGFLLCGLSVLFLNSKWYRFSLIGGIYGLVLSTLTLAEYAFRVNLHIDELLMHAYTRAGATSPGRMAICTAINFAIIGLVVIIAQRRGTSAWNSRLIGSFGTLVMGLGVIAIPGYLSGVTDSNVWVQFSRMALHTALGFIILGAGIVSYAWIREQSASESVRMPDWTPAVVGIATATISVCIWQVMIVNQSEQIDLIRKLQQINVGVQVTGLIETQVLLTKGALVFGLGLSALLSGVVYIVQTAQRHALEVDQMNSTLGSVNIDLNQQVQERVQAEAALRQVRDELESRVIQRTAELALANSDLEEALEEKRLSAERQRKFLREILSSVTEGRLTLCDCEDDLPAPITGLGESINLTLDDIRSIRRYAGHAAESAGLPDERSFDLLTAVGEAAMNAVVHGGGGEGTVYCLQSGAVQVWITDRGHGIDIKNLHQATLRRGFTTAGSFGHGFWMMLKVVDKVWLLTGPTGTTVVLEQHREEVDSFLNATLNAALELAA